MKRKFELNFRNVASFSPMFVVLMFLILVDVNRIYIQTIDVVLLLSISCILSIFCLPKKYFWQNPTSQDYTSFYRSLYSLKNWNLERKELLEYAESIYTQENPFRGCVATIYYNGMGWRKIYHKTPEKEEEVSDRTWGNEFSVAERRVHYVTKIYDLISKIKVS